MKREGKHECGEDMGWRIAVTIDLCKFLISNTVIHTIRKLASTLREGYGRFAILGRDFWNVRILGRYFPLFLDRRDLILHSQTFIVTHIYYYALNALLYWGYFALKKKRFTRGISRSLIGVYRAAIETWSWEFYSWLLFSAFLAPNDQM